MRLYLKQHLSANHLVKPSFPVISHTIAVNQATALPSVTTFESQLLESQAQDEIIAPTKGSQAGTVATTEAGDSGNS